MICKQPRKFIVNPNYKFSIPLTQRPPSPYLTDEAWISLFKKLFGQKKLSIYLNDYESYHISTVFANLIITDIENLELQYTGQSKVLQFLSFPFFKDLKHLSLGNNKIFSLEFFSYIPAPNLQNITLNDNKIQNLRPMHKNRFDNLKSIDLRGNQIHELKGIQSLATVQLILQNLDYDKVMSYHIHSIFKLPNNQMKIIRIQGFDRISEPKIEEQFKKRWPKVWVYKKKQKNL